MLLTEATPGHVCRNLYDSFICATWLVDVCNVTHMIHTYVRRDALMRVTWLSHTRDITFWYLWRDSYDSFIRACDVTDMTHLYVRHDSSIRAPWLIHTCAVTLWSVERISAVTQFVFETIRFWENSFLRRAINQWSFLLNHTSPIRWLRFVNSLKTYVSFAKELYKRDYILEKRRIFWRSLLIIATPYLYDSSTRAPWLFDMCV